MTYQNIYFQKYARYSIEITLHKLCQYIDNHCMINSNIIYDFITATSGCISKFLCFWGIVRRSRARWTTLVLRCDIFREFSSFESNLSITCYSSRKKPILSAIRTTYYGTLIDSKILTYSYINGIQTRTVQRCLFESYL